MDKKQMIYREDYFENLENSQDFYWESLEEFDEWVKKVKGAVQDIIRRTEGEFECLSITCSCYQEYDDVYDQQRLELAYRSEETDLEMAARLKRERKKTETEKVGEILKKLGYSNELAYSEDFQKLYLEGKLKHD